MVTDAPRMKRRISLLEFNSAPDGFVSLSDFVKQNFADPDRPALAKIRRRKADERLSKEKVPTPAYLRLLKGLSQAQLAAEIGSSQAAIARMEGGFERPSFEKILKLQQALETSFDDLMEAISNVPLER
ncbi:MAG: helix-turn-helix transcriptional regulator [Erythrobacter sp.]